MQHRDAVADTFSAGESAERLAAVVKRVKEREGRLRLSLVHARNDWDIPSHEDDLLFRAAVSGLVSREMDADDFKAAKAARTVVRGKDSFVTIWREANVVVRQELFPYGGEFGCQNGICAT
jgi:phosphosulfolactate phosphohydrolase-like enzyme